MKKTGWIPGYRSKFKELDKERKDIVKAKKVKNDAKFRKSKWVYNEEDVIEARSKPIIRCSSAYLDQHHKNKFFMRSENSKKILKKKSYFDKKTKTLRAKPVGFSTRFKKLRFDQNVGGKKTGYLNSKEAFKEVNFKKLWRKKEKDKWMGESFKIA